MKARVIVRLKPAVHDPQGETIFRSLRDLGYSGVRDIRQGKYFEVSLEAGSREEAESIAREIASRVLSNPVLEVFEVDVSE